MPIDSQEIAAKLELYSTLLALADEDSFKSRAFSNAARTIASIEEPLDKLIAENRLAEIKGIGKNTASIIVELVEKNTFADLETIQQKVPAGVLDLLKVQGLGPQKAKQLWHEVNITSLAELEAAILEGKLNKLSGFGGKTIEKFQQSIQFLKQNSSRHLRHHARKAKDKLEDNLKSIAGAQEILFGGSWRRNCETIRDLDVILKTDEANLASVNFDLQTRVKGLAIREQNHRGYLEGDFEDFEIEISACNKEEFPFRSLIVTGSKAHYQALSEYAAQKGFRLTPSSLLDKNGYKIPATSEADIYKTLGLEFVPPPLREDEKSQKPLGSHKFTEAVKLSDLKGILHVHTTYSDGHSSLTQMAEALIKLEEKYHAKFEYIGICDHSQAAAYARGLTHDRVKAQWQEIDELNQKLVPFKILKGTEVDILAGGRLDFDDNLLSQFDFVVASVHSGFKMTEEEATERLCNAISNPHVDILGHMTGRLLLERDGYPVNHEKVIECAAKHKKAIELNCNPHRLDIDWRWLKLAMEAGVMIPLDPDSHSARALEDIEYGIDLAAKGPVTPDFCPSAWTVTKFLDWCKQHS